MKILFLGNLLKKVQRQSFFAKAGSTASAMPATSYSGILLKALKKI